MDSRQKGAWAERAAARFLEATGYRVVARNIRLQRGELDLIAVRGGQLWFVEVKSRGRSDRGSPLRAIDARKRRALYSAAREYISQTGFRGDFGFLAVSVLPGLEGALPRINATRITVRPPAAQ